MPHFGSSATSTSAIRLLTVGSHPGNSMPAALRIRLRPPSQPTRYCARSDAAVGQRDIDAGVVLRETGHLDSAIDRDRQLPDPAGQDALDVVLPQPEPVIVPGGKVADVQRDAGEAADLRTSVPPRGTDRRCPADRAPRSCARAGRRRASRRVPGWRAARQWQHRRPPAPTRPPASVPSVLRRRSPPHVRSLPHPFVTSVAIGFGRPFTGWSGS